MKNTYSRSPLCGLDGALELDRKTTGEMFSKYVNPGLKTLLSAIGFNKCFVRAEGVSVFDENGDEYLDFLGGYGSLPFGHNPPEILEGMAKIDKMPNFLQAHTNPFQAALAHDLSRITPEGLDITFFSNSGTEAVESALKLARAATGRTIFVYCDGAFHGKTLGSLAVGGREKYRKPFEPLMPETVGVPFGDIDSLDKVLKEKACAAFIVEPVQGEAGVILPPEGYLEEARKITTRTGALLIFDEVQTGFGRTGTMFACQAHNVVPDIMCMAKALGGGVMPIGATICKKATWEKAYGGLTKAILHTSTFGGGTRACAAALLTIQKIIHEQLDQRAAELGTYFLAALKTLKERYQLIKEVRGKGLLIGLEFDKPVSGVLDKISAGSIGRLAKEYFASIVAGELMNKYGVITAYTLNNPNVMRLEPPLIVAKEQIDHVLNSLEDIFGKHKSMFSLAVSFVKSKK
jgi:putrescine aminotransferase